MKKVTAMIIVLVLTMGMLAIASANDDPIWRDVDVEWKNNNREEYRMFRDTHYDSTGFVKDHTAYYASYACGLWYDEEHDLEYIKRYFSTVSSDLGLTDFTSNVEVIGTDEEMGRKIVRLTLNTTTDLTKVEKAGFDQFYEPVYAMVLICYDRMYNPDRW